MLPKEKALMRGYVNAHVSDVSSPGETLGRFRIPVEWNPETKVVFIPVPPQDPGRTHAHILLRGVLEACIGFGEDRLLGLYGVEGGYRLDLKETPKTWEILARMIRSHTEA